jgi:cystathionine beta-lyase
VRSAIVEAVEREDFGYVAADLSELTSACADFLAAQYGWTISPTRVFPVADVLSAIRTAIELLVPPDRGVVVPTPAYPPFFEIVELAGRTAIKTPMAYERARAVLDLDAINDALAAGAGAVLLCNPHNPTGRAFTADELGALATIVDRHGARVIADEVHAPLVYAGNRHVPYASVSDATSSHAITVTSASKAFNLAGLKCAQVIASNHDDAKRWRELRVFETPGPTPIGIAASIAAYEDGREWLQGLVTYLEANRARVGEFLASELPAIRWVSPEATFMAWLDCTELGLGDPARFFLDRAHVALSDGLPFGPGCGQFVRFNFATSRALLDRILHAIAVALASRV